MLCADQRPDEPLLCFVQVTLFWHIWQISNPLLHNHFLGLIQIESSNSPLISNKWIVMPLTDAVNNISGTSSMNSSYNVIQLVHCFQMPALLGECGFMELRVRKIHLVTSLFTINFSSQFSGNIRKHFCLFVNYII